MINAKLAFIKYGIIIALISFLLISQIYFINFEFIWIFIIGQFLTMIFFIFLFKGKDKSVIRKFQISLKFNILPLIIFVLNLWSFIYILIQSNSLFSLIIITINYSFTIGYIFLDISGIKRRLNSTERIGFSFALSFFFLNTLWICLTIYFNSMKSIIMISFCLFISFLYIIYSYLYKKTIRIVYNKSISINKIKFFICLFLPSIIQLCILYPYYLQNVYVDMSYHLSASINLAKNIDIYYELYGTYYLFAHFIESILFDSINPSFISLNLIMVLLTFISPIFFYSLMNRLMNKDDKAPMFATWLYYTGLTGGISWILFYFLSITSPELSLVSTIWETSIRSVNSLWAGFLVCYYYPITFAFMFFIMGLNILFNKNLKGNQRWLLTLITFSLMFLTHMVEAIIFALFIFILSFYKNFKISIKNSISGIMSGCIFSAAILFSIHRYANYLHPSIENSYYVLSFIFLVSIFIYLINIYMESKIIRFSNYLDKVFNSKQLKVIFFIIIYLNFVGIITWILKFNDNDYITKYTSIFGSVPWFLYSIILGAANIITLFYFYNKAKIKKLSPSFRFSIFSLLIFFCFARFLYIFSYITNTVFYWENRFIAFMLIPITFICSCFFYEKLKSRKNRGKLRFFPAVLLIIVIFSNYNIIILNTVSRYYASKGNVPMSGDLVNGLDTFSEMLIDKPNALVITHSDESNRLLRLVGASYAKTITIDDLNDFYSLLYDKNMEKYSHVYFFLTNYEYRELINEKSPLYDLLNMSEIILKNSEISVYNLHKLTPSLNQGFINLILDKSNLNYKVPQNFLSVLLSKSKLNYSINLNSDNRISKLKENYILSIDPVDENLFRGYEFLLDYWETNFGYFEFKTNEILLGDNEFNLPGEAFYNCELNKTKFDFSIKLTKISGIYNTYGIKFQFYNENKTQLKIFDISFSQNPQNEIILAFYDNKTLDKDYYSTNISWELDKKYDFSMKTNRGNITIAFNNTQIYNKELNFSNYFLGIEYYRIQRAYILINDMITDINSTYLKSDQYLKNTIKMIENNSKICVFNFNGYQKYGNEILDLDKEIESDIITQIKFSDNETHSINCSLNKYIFPLKSHYNSKANFILENGTIIPFIVNFGLNQNTSILYINLYPIFRQIIIENECNNFDKIIFFEKVLQIIIDFFSDDGENNLRNYNVNNLWEGYVDSLEISDSKLMASSVLLDEEFFNQIESVEIEYENGTINHIDDLNTIYWNYSDEIIKIDSGMLYPYFGAYTLLQFENETKIMFPNGNTIKITNENSSIINIINVKFLTLRINSNISNSFSIIIKSPKIISNLTIMNKWLPKNVYESPIKEIGKNVTIIGLNSYNFLSSSDKIILFNINVEECNLLIIDDENDIQQYNEIESIIIALKVIVYSSPILLLYFIYNKIKKRKDRFK